MKYYSKKEIVEILKNESSELFKITTSLNYYFHVKLNGEIFNMKQTTFNSLLNTLNVDTIETSTDDHKVLNKYNLSKKISK